MRQVEKTNVYYTNHFELRCFISWRIYNSLYILISWHCLEYGDARKGDFVKILVMRVLVIYTKPIAL